MRKLHDMYTGVDWIIEVTVIDLDMYFILIVSNENLSLTDTFSAKKSMWKLPKLVSPANIGVFMSFNDL